MCNNCNPCDDCAPKCQECCNPNIQWDWCITVDQSEEGVITIKSNCLTEVTSDDDSVTVVEKTPHEWYSKRFDLSVDTSDTKVWACWWDTNPGPLDSKLRVTWALTKETKNCSWDGYIELWIDTAKLNIPDVKVAVTSWCDGKYLSDALKCTADNLEFSVSWCTMTLRNKKPQYACGKIILQDSVKWQVSWHDSWFFYLIDPNLAPSFGINPAVALAPSYNLDALSRNMHHEWWILVCEKTWLYQVWFSAAFEAWFWIHWMRVDLAVVWDNKVKWILLESRYSWPVWQTPYDLGMWTEPKYNTLYIAENTEVDWVNWDSASLGWVLDRMDCWQSTIVELEEWDALVLVARVQAATKYAWDYLNWYDRWWKFAVLWMIGSQSGWDVWAQIYAYLLQPL